MGRHSSFFNFRSVTFVFAIYFFAFFLFSINSNAEQKTDPKTTKETVESSKVETEKKAPAKKDEKKKGVPKRMFAHFELTHDGKPFGKFKVKLFFRRAPETVDNFVGLAEGSKQFTEYNKSKGEIGTLVRRKFYDGLQFHRVIRGFMIQGGDPNTKSGNKSSWGMGGPGYTVKAEFNSRSHLRGIVSMARAQDPDSAGSQFFIVTSDSTFLDRQYTVFGEVIEGMDVADKIVNLDRDGNDCPLEKAQMIRVTVG